MNGVFPEDSTERKTYPVYSGLLQYFPAALAAVAHHSYIGNAKHNAGLPLHHDRAKSGDEADAMIRHAMEGDLVGMAWRALSWLQKDLEAKGAPIAPAARNADRAQPPVIPHALAAAMLRDRALAQDDDTAGEAEPPRMTMTPNCSTGD